MNLDNKWVNPTLKDFINSVPFTQQYFCIGSVSLLSFTKKTYDRKIKDIDIICEIKNFETIKNNLIKLGYQQYTFINKKFPFSKQLLKLAQSKYFRFEKNGKDLEIMTSDFGDLKEEILVELYPGIKFSFPSSGVVNSSFEEINLKTISPEILFCIYSFGLKTWGFFVRKNIEQRKTDLQQLKKIINKEKLNKITNNIFLAIGKFKLKVPAFLMQ